MVRNVDRALRVSATICACPGAAAENIAAVRKVIRLGNQQKRRRYVQKHQETDG
jgi:hypothetical protein